MSFDILVTAPTIEPDAREMLEAAGCSVSFVSAAGGRVELEAKLAAAPFAGIFSRQLPISAAAMASCPSLRVISRAAAGYDLIDLPAATARGIPVMSAAGANAVSVAEYAIGLMLSCARNIPHHHQVTSAGGWDRSQVGIELHGRTLGLVGYGHIAKHVARIALAMGMRVTAWTPRLGEAGDISPVERAASLEALLSKADVLSLHCPLTAESRGMIGAAQLALLPRGAMLVNTARGALIDEPALAAALTEGRLYRAALDVRVTEPPPAGHPLMGVPNLIQTSHMGAATFSARSAAARLAVTSILDVLLGRPTRPGACVNPEVLTR